MSDIVEFVRHGAAKVTPTVIEAVHKKLPYLKIEFAQIQDSRHPHLANQLEFLADVVEDFAEGADKELSYAAVSAAVFALAYAHQQLDLIPDDVPEFGHADDSAVVRAVLMEHERALSSYADRHDMNWSTITVRA